MISVSTLHQDITIPGGSEGKEFTCSVGDLGSVPRLGRSLGEGNGYPLQYSCLGKSMDRGAWQATVHGVAKSQTQQLKQLSMNTHIKKDGQEEQKNKKTSRKTSVLGCESIKKDYE